MKVKENQISFKRAQRVVSMSFLAILCSSSELLAQPVAASNLAGPPPAPTMAVEQTSCKDSTAAMDLLPRISGIENELSLLKKAQGGSTIPIVVALIAIAGALVGNLANNYLESKRTERQTINDKKRDVYFRFMSIFDAIIVKEDGCLTGIMAEVILIGSDAVVRKLAVVSFPFSETCYK